MATRLSAVALAILAAAATLGPAFADATAPTAPHASAARISGFTDFAAPNISGRPTSVGFNADRTVLALTDGTTDMAVSAFAKDRQRITSWRAQFTYQATGFGTAGAPGADGAAFILQNDARGTRALGGTGNSLGYAGDTAPIGHSAAFRLVLYQYSGQGVAIDGVGKTLEDTGGVDLGSHHPIRVSLLYDGAVLTESLKDLTTGDTNEQEDALNIPAAVGGDTALVGFSGASGALTARQTITDFSFVVLPDVPPAKRKHLHPVIHEYHTRADYVNPLIGTAGGGNTYPGAVVPFGMVQFSPDTRAPGIGYDYHDHQIQGFSLTHMSGVGCNDYGDVFLTATTGPIRTAEADYRSGYSHRSETAQPGYYQVRLSRPGVNVELSATEHCGVARFTFPAAKAANILIPISHTLTTTYGASVEVVSDDEIDGQVTSRSFCGANQRYTVYFAMALDHPFQSFGTWAGSTTSSGSRKAAQPSEHFAPVGAYVTYPAGVGSVTARIGLSFVDLAGARANLKAEATGRSFNQIRRAAYSAWNKELGLLEIQGGTTEQRVVFYTSLYHALLMPNVISDVDGRYLGFDHKIHRTAVDHPIYANFSGWDIYRTEAPLLCLIEPRRMQDMCQSIVAMYRQGGWIGRWPQANTYTNVMCGSPLTVVMSTAWQYGLHGFDMTAGYEGMLKDATTAAPPGMPYRGEVGVEWMNKIGYIPYAPSNTEEDCIAYASLAYLAKALGKSKDAAMLRQRALDWRNLFNPATRFISPRKADGTWVKIDPTAGDHYVEGSAWQYRWLVPEDVLGLVRLMGGDSYFNSQLDEFFSYPHVEWKGHYYNPYNEPDLQAPFLYDYSGEPWKTQARVRELQADAYKAAPDGIPGNDDCGTMSAWYVLSAMGLYPVDPADGTLELCNPLFPQVTIHLSAPYAGRTFTIRTVSSGSPYLKAVHLGREDWHKPWIPVSALAHGGSLTFTLGAQPNKTWGADTALRPPSLSVSSD